MADCNLCGGTDRVSTLGVETVARLTKCPSCLQAEVERLKERLDQMRKLTHPSNLLAQRDAEIERLKETQGLRLGEMVDIIDKQAHDSDRLRTLLENLVEATDIDIESWCQCTKNTRCDMHLVFDRIKPARAAAEKELGGAE